MMEISPAILTDDSETFKQLLKNYCEVGFKSIDIDIQEVPFASSKTLSFDAAFVAFQAVTIPLDAIICWDLKLAEPENAARALREYDPEANICVYSDAETSFEMENLILGVKDTVEVKDLKDLGRFAGVQLMTVRDEQQGTKLDPELLDKVTQLREMGYTGKVSIDGGVNLKSAEQILEYDIQKVSVGSYFQKSKNLILDKYKLELALNLK